MSGIPARAPRVCSPACGSIARKNGHKQSGSKRKAKQGGSWSEAAKAKRREQVKSDPKMQETMRNLWSRATESRRAIPEGQKDIRNRCSKFTVYIDPTGHKHPVLNAKNWARRNYKLFYPDAGEDDLERCTMAIWSGFMQLVNTLRGTPARLKAPVHSYKGWTVDPECLPRKIDLKFANEGALKIVEMYINGSTTPDIAATLCVEQQFVMDVINGFRFPKPVPKIDSNFLDGQSKQIAELFMQGVPINQISKQTNISWQKVTKTLVTMELIETEEAKLFRAGVPVGEIAAHLGESVRQVEWRVPYSKGAYMRDNPTDNALRIRKHRAKHKDS